MKNGEALAPQARADGLIVQELGEEVLIYDLERHRAHCLNRTAALVWKQCDGRKTVGQLARVLGAELGRPVNHVVVGLALDQLHRSSLLRGPAPRRASQAVMSRRELARSLGLAAAALPLVASITAPTAAQAATLLPVNANCSVDGDCASQCCPAGICLPPEECELSD